MDRKYNVGDWVEYNFCGGTSYAYINGYKWYVPRAYENSNGDMIYPEAHIIYLCSKLVGMSFGVPYWKTIWSPGRNSEGQYPVHQTLPVWQTDIVNKFDWETPFLTRFYGPNKEYNFTYRNPFYMLDKTKYEQERDDLPAGYKRDTETYLQHQVERFEIRKKEVLERKLCR